MVQKESKLPAQRLIMRDLPFAAIGGLSPGQMLAGIMTVRRFASGRLMLVGPHRNGVIRWIWLRCIRIHCCPGPPGERLSIAAEQPRSNDRDSGPGPRLHPWPYRGQPTR